MLTDFKYVFFVLTIDTSISISMKSFYKNKSCSSGNIPANADMKAKLFPWEAV